MRVARIAGMLLGSLLAQQAQAQSLGPPSSWRFGRSGIMAGISYKQYDTYSAHLSGMYYLTPETRPLSFRVQGYASWSPFQTTIARAPASLGLNYLSDVSSGTSREIGGGIAAILHARPKSRVSPYLIAGYGIFQHWQDGSVQRFDAEGRAAVLTPWPHSYSGSDFSAGAGVRARVGGQTFRLEATKTNNRIAVSVGMSLPF
ncbi:MAG TPA: hypothetical protein VGP87_08050 [Gemmatimonadales bacterium]|nr:hypothetical protein [Gemmatimonadales bacterium]